jgi:hypothetical protein
MDRRRFFGFCVAGAGTLAGCPARSQDAGSGAESDGATGDTPTETDTTTPFPPVDGS